MSTPRYNHLRSCFDRLIGRAEAYRKVRASDKAYYSNRAAARVLDQMLAEVQREISATDKPHNK